MIEFIDFPSINGSSIKLAVDADRGVFDNIIASQTTISDNARLIIALLQGDGTLIDVGANIGSIALPVADSGSNVVAVEMLPKNLLKLISATMENGFSNVEIVSAAASDHDATVYYEGTEAWGVVSTAGSEAISLRLDTIVRLKQLRESKALVEPVVLKIDVEGHEPQVLRGARYLIDTYRPAILFESIDMPGTTEVAARESKELLAGSGYKLYLTRGNTLCERSPLDLQEGLVCDFLAIPQEKVAAVKSLLGSYQFAPLSEEQRIGWMRELMSEGRDHQMHAIKAISHLRSQSEISQHVHDELIATLAASDDEGVRLLAESV